MNIVPITPVKRHPICKTKRRMSSDWIAGCSKPSVWTQNWGARVGVGIAAERRSGQQWGPWRGEKRSSRWGDACTPRPGLELPPQGPRTVLGLHLGVAGAEPAVPARGRGSPRGTPAGGRAPTLPPGTRASGVSSVTALHTLTGLLQSFLPPRVCEARSDSHSSIPAPTPRPHRRLSAEGGPWHP